MESKPFLLNKSLRNRIQGSIGELVGLEYICDKLKKEYGDVIFIVKNMNPTVEGIIKNLNPNKDYVLVPETPFMFLRHKIIEEFRDIGCEAMDFTNGNIEVKNLFDKYRSKTKKQILSEIERLYMGYRKETEKIKEESVPVK